MTVIEEFQQAVLDGNFGHAETLLPLLADLPRTVEETQAVRELLAGALQMVRISQAHDAFRLTQLSSLQHRTAVCEAYVSSSQHLL